MPVVEKRPVVYRKFSGSRYSCEHCDYWGQLHANLNLFRAHHDKGKPQHHSVSLLKLFAKLAAQATQHWAAVGDMGCSPAAYTAQLRSITLQANGLDGLLSGAKRQKEHWVYMRAKTLRENFRVWLMGALQNGAGAAHVITKDPGASCGLATEISGVLVTEPLQAIDARRTHWAHYWTNMQEHHDVKKWC